MCRYACDISDLHELRARDPAAGAASAEPSSTALLVLLFKLRLYKADKASYRTRTSFFLLLFIVIVILCHGAVYYNTKKTITLTNNLDFRSSYYN